MTIKHIVSFNLKDNTLPIKENCHELRVFDYEI